jgi:hypothetical protein
MPQPVADLVTETLGMDAKSAAFDPELRKKLEDAVAQIQFA